MKKSIAIFPALLAVMLAACGARDPAAILAEGQAAFDAHDYRTAMIHGLNLISDDQGNLDARILLGKASLELGDIVDAGNQLTLAQQGGAPLTAYAVPLAEAHARSDRVEDALSLLESVPETGRDDAYYSVYAELLVANGDLVRAAAMLEDMPLPTDGAARADRLVVRARLESARGNLAAAEVAVAAALDADPTNPDIWVVGARLASEAGDRELAGSRLLRAVDLYEQRVQLAYAAPALLELVRLQLAQDRIEAAEVSATRLATLQDGSAAANFAAGLIAYEKGDYTDAVDALRRAAISAPNNPEVLTVLGAAFLASGSLGQAEQQLAAAASEARQPATIRLLAETRLRRNRPGDALIALNMLPAEIIAGDPGLATLKGVALLADGQTDAAIAALEQARQSAPADAGVTLQLARAYLAAGRADEATALVNSSTTLSVDATFASNLGLMLARLQGESEEAARRFVDELIAANPDSAPNVLIAGTLEFLTGNRNAAEDRAASALALDRGFVPAYLLNASLALEAGDTDAAETSLRQALDAAPGHPAASAGLARLHIAAGDVDGAMAVLSAVPSDAAPIEVLSLQGALALEQGDLSAADSYASLLRQRFPLRAAGRSLEGQIETVRGRDAAAATAFEAAYELEPGYATLQSAVLSAQRAGSSSWRRLLDQRLRAAPDDAVARMLLANGLLGDGRLGEALTAYREVLRTETQNATALNNAAWLAHELNEPGALDYARRAKALAPDNASVLDTYGWLLTESDRAMEGLPELEEAARLAPETYEIRYHLAVAQARTGRATEARSNAEALLREPAAASTHADARRLLESL